MKKIIIGLILISFICGCSSTKNKEIDNSLEKILNSNNYLVIDVRTKEEYEEGHVVDSLNIPYDEIDENIALDKSKTILVYCRSGKRSSIAYKSLSDLGYDVYDLGAYASITLPKE